MSRAPATPEASAHGAVLARGAFFSTLAFLASNLRAIFMLLVARLLGSAVLGTFGLAWASMDLLSKFATLGLDYSAIAFVAKAEAANDRVGSRRIFRASLFISVGSGLVLAFVASVLTWWFGPRFGLRPELARAASIMMLAIPGLALYRVSNALSRGMAVMHHDIYSRGLTESLGTAAALLGALALGVREIAPEIAAIVGTLASGLVAFFLAHRLYTSQPPARGREEDGMLLQRLVRASTPIALYDFLNLGVMHIDVIMLGWFVGRAPGVTLKTLGIYAAAVQLVGGLRKVGGVFVPIFTPVVARQISSGELRAAEETYGYLARWMLAILLPALVILTLSGGALMTIFGAAFYRGGVWAAIIGTACAINAFVGLGETILMIERPGMNLINSTVAFLAAIGLNLILIPALGPLGAAIGMLVPYSLQGILRGAEISWLLKWRWPWRALLKPWLAALLPLPVALLARLFARGIIWEFAAAATYLVGYLLAWWIIGLERRDRDALEHLFKRAQPNQPQCEKVNMQ
ncbi:MAG: oligosaccharide flippase family protein [Chthoniobacterales bacterium]